jgi:glycosyltransferase involved in cell wall biosynthesis
MTKLLYCGNLGLGHELETVLRAAHELDHGIELQVIFVGTGALQKRLKELTQELGLDNVEFRPPVPLFKLPELLASGDIHLVSQKPGTEGLLVPSKIYGILAAGKPVLFVGPCDCEIAAIIMASGAGLIVQPGNVDGLVDALKRLASNPAIREAMGASGKAYYEMHLGRQRSVSQIIKAIESIVQPQ